MKRVLQILALVAAFALPAFCQYSRLSAHDQHEFDEAYNKWVKDSRKNDRDDVARDERKMQSIMQHNNIPTDVPYDRIATNGYANRDQYDRDRYQNDQGQYNNRDRDDDRGRYDNPGYQNGGARLSPDDQHEFDRVYSKWVNDSRRNDRDDIQKDERKMQDIMSRYNIPSDVPYDQIATPGDAGYRR
jgi:hypothetical protein